MDFFLTKTQKKNKELRELQKNVQNLEENRQCLEVACVSIGQTNGLMDKVIQKFKAANYEKETEAIDKIPNLGDEYKKELKEQILKTKEQALSTLKPLAEDSSKLEGNMHAAKVASKAKIVVLKMQRNVLEAGKTSVEAVKQLNKEGAENAKKIKEMLKEVESINNVTRNALLTYRDSQKEIDNLISNNSNTDSLEELIDQI